jgi:hypothetical protein
MTDLTAKFVAFEEQVAGEHTAVMAALEALQSSLDLVASNSELALENGATNTKAIIAALGQTGACFPCPTPSIVVPPTSPTTVPVDTDHCKRSQWIIATIHSLLANMDTLQSFNVIGTFSILNDTVSQVISAIAAGDTIPLPSFPETVNIVGDYVSYAGERLFSGVGLIDQFAPLESELVTAVYTSSNAEGAQAAYNGVIEGAGVSNGARLLFEAIAYNALWSYALDPASMPDLSAFDGSACSFPSGTCYTINLLHTTSTPSSFSDEAVSGDFGPFAGNTTVTTSASVETFTLPIWYAQDPLGWTWEVLNGSADLQWRLGGLTDTGVFSATGVAGVDGIAHAFPTAGTWVIVGSVGGQVRICKA